MRKGPIALAALLALVAACGGDSTGPDDGMLEADLHFLRPAADAPPLAQTSVTFWAYRDRQSEGDIWYRPRPGHNDSTEFVEFKVPDRSISQDSVQITITVVDQENLVVQFEPSGLQFDPRRPARLKFEYAEADDDINDDGLVDQTDEQLKPLLSVWRREQAGQPWFKVPSISIEVSDEIEADITGFTHYAIAY